MGRPEIEKEALQLSDEDRAELTGLLIESLDGADPHDRGGDSLEEATRRGAELKSGAVEGIEEAVFLNEFRAARRG